MQRSSEQICTELDIGRNALDKVRRRLRNRGLLVDYQPVEDEIFEVITRVVEVQRAKRCPWEIAVDIVLDEKHEPAAETVTEAELGDELVRELFSEFCLENGIASGREADFLGKLVDDELKETRKLVGNLMIRALAFTHAAGKGYITLKPLSNSNTV